MLRTYLAYYRACIGGEGKEEAVVQQFFYLDHIGSLDQGIELANELLWNLTITQGEGTWFVNGGEKTIFKADNRDAVEAFVYGLSLAYAVLPPHLFDVLRDGMKALVE